MEKPFHFLQSEKQLQDFLSKIQDESLWILDLEADNQHSYQEKICLLQLTSPQGDIALIDPLEIKDLSPFLQQIRQKTLWMHGIDYDLRLMSQAWGFVPKTIYDTQVAARFLGHTRFSLAALLEEHFQITLDKSSQRAQWQKRPLTEKLLHYAAQDVAHLLPLAQKLEKQLKEKNRWQWFLQTCQTKTDAFLMPTKTKPPTKLPWKIAGSGKLKPRGLAALQLLWQWRDSCAQDADCIPNRILHSSALLHLAQRAEGRQALLLPRKITKPAQKETLLETFEAIKKHTPADFPSLPKTEKRRLTTEQKAALKTLRTQRDALASQHQIDPTLLLTREEMENIAFEPALKTQLLDWKKELFAFI